MEDTSLNTSQICVITSYYKKQSTYFDYKKRKVFLWWTIRKEGFYFLNSWISPEAIKTVYDGIFYTENKKVFIKPHIEIHMSNNTVYKKYFKKIEELLEYLENSKLNKIPLIKC